MKSKIIKALIICLIVAGVGTGGYFGYKKIFAAKPTVSAASYITMKASKMNLQVNVQGTGAAYAANSKKVTAGSNGTLKDLNLKAGDTVKAGDKLFTVDSDQLKQNVTKAQLNLDKLKLQLAQAKTAADNAAAAGTDAAASTPSLQSDNTPKNQNSTPASGQTNNQNGSSKANYDNQIASLNLEITSAESDLAEAKAALSSATVKAPIDGVIVEKTVENGDTVQSNTAILTIMDTNSTKIKVAIDELDIEKVQIGQKADVKFDAIKDKTYEGTVESVGITGNSSNNVTTYDVIIGIKDPSGIRFGMNANVNILIQSKDNVLAIPVEALIENNGKKYVRVQSSSNGQNNSGFAGNSGGLGNSNTSGNTGTSENSQSSANRQSSRNNQTQRTNRQNTQQTGNNYNSASVGRLVEIKTGIQNENYVEVLEGLTEGENLIVMLPQTSTTNNNNRNAIGGFGNFNGAGRQLNQSSAPKNNTGSNSKGN